MKIDGLIPFNGETIQTKALKEMGFSTNDINRLLNDKVLERTRRGYYKVSLKCNVDIKLMKYYLMNNYFDEFLTYFDSLTIKDYQAYYYRFMYDIMIGSYSNAYEHLNKCCELNKKNENKISLYAYILLINELMNLSNDKFIALKNKVFTEEDSLNLFIEAIINKDYDSACKNLRVSKNYDVLSKLEIKVLRDLSIKANECYQKKNSKERKQYDLLFNNFYEYIINNDYDSAYFSFRKLCMLSSQFGIIDSKLNTINDLFNCFNYIVEHPQIDLDTYKTDYKYDGILKKDFFLALKRNDYVKALELISIMTKKEDNQEYIIYKCLLQRIYNFLNIRSVIKSRDPRRNQLSLNGLIEKKRYKEAIDFTNRSNNMSDNDKNMINSILESIVALEDNTLFNSDN